MVDSEKERIWAEGGVSHTEARRLAKEKIEGELTDEEYLSAIREIDARSSPGQQAARLILPPLEQTN